MNSDFKETLIAMSKEFDDKDGYVTCEVSIHKDKIDEVENFIKENTNIKNGKWIIMECDTCVEYHGEGYLHASIERPETISEMETSTNHIKTFN